MTGNITISINTAVITVTLPGSIYFNNKSKLQLPLNTSLNVTSGTLIGDCSNNNSILINSVDYTVCAGTGSTGQTFCSCDFL